MSKVIPSMEMQQILHGIACPNEAYVVAKDPAPLVGMRFPSPSIFPRLLNAGISSVVCLTADSVSYDPSPLQVCFAVTLRDLCDGGNPSDPAAEILKVRSARDAVLSELVNGRGVAVHCQGGRGRTGTVLGCVLVALGESPDRVISYLNEIHVARGKQGWPESEWQRDVVLESASWPLRDPRADRGIQPSNHAETSTMNQVPAEDMGPLTASDWASLKRVKEVLMGRTESTGEAPSVAVQRLVRTVFLHLAPSEYRSLLTPTFPADMEDDEILVDNYLGLYEPGIRKVTLFGTNIDKVASQLECPADSLRYIVSLHEYGHALVHIGIALRDVEEMLAIPSGTHETDWTTLAAQRTETFNAIDTDAHERLAQAITYSVICQMGNDELLSIFEKLEMRQPARYRLAEGVKKGAAEARWEMILPVIRKAVCEDASFSLSDAVQALIE